MPNHYFQFKQFKVLQDKCAMKVCTDSCLFGAWILVNEQTTSILDIGTGTGLLSLMLAQKSKAKIDAIEINESAYLQATENFKNSAWSNKLSVFLGDVTTYQFPIKYDLIVCNPPFYQNEMSSSAKEEKIAKHSLNLTLPHLLTSINNTLNENGKFAILLPYYRKNEFEDLAAKYHYFPEKILAIKQTDKHDFFRYAAIYSRKKYNTVQQEFITIKHNHLHYTKETIKILKDYYLYL